MPQCSTWNWNEHILGVSDVVLGACIEIATGIRCKSDDVVNKLLRGIYHYFFLFIDVEVCALTPGCIFVNNELILILLNY